MGKNIYLTVIVFLSLFLQKASTQGQCPYLYCEDFIHVAVGNDCEALIIPDYLLPIDTCTHLNYEINIYDQMDNPVPNPVTQEYFYTELIVEFFDLNLNEPCTTRMIVEDKLPPVINGISGPGIISCLSNLGEVFTVDVTENCDYTVEVSSAGSYQLQIRYASQRNNNKMRVQFNDVNVTEVISLPNTGGWGNWQTLTVPVSLKAGRQVMSLLLERQVINLDWVQFRSDRDENRTPKVAPAIDG